MSLDVMYGKIYNENTYNCAHFTCDLWELITGYNLSNNLGSLLLPPLKRSVRGLKSKVFDKLNQPVSPCLVLFSNSINSTHIGVFINGRVMHISKQGVRYETLYDAKIGFSKVRFYSCLKN